MKNELIIYDASYLVYAGTASSHFDHANIAGMNFGGLHFLMEKVFYHLSTNKCVAIAMDSKCDKKEEFSEYKSTRSRSADVAVQLAAIYEFAKRMNIPVFKYDGYEADDVIFNLVQANQFLYETINIYTADADVYSNIINKSISCIGCSSTQPLVNWYNYDLVAKKGEYIPVNSILPYIMAYGKPSNNIGSAKLSSGVTADRLYGDFYSFLEENEGNSGKFSDKQWAFRWIMSKASKIPKEDISYLRRRMNMIYPKVISDEDFAVPYCCWEKLNQEQMVLFMGTFNLIGPAFDMKLSRQVNGIAYKANSGSQSEESKRIIRFYKEMLTSGELYNEDEMHSTIEDFDYTSSSLFTVDEI